MSHLRDDEDHPAMERGKRGLALTICALGFGLLAISDLTKPFSQSHDAQAGLVFLGNKLTGTADLNHRAHVRRVSGDRKPRLGSGG